MGLRTKFNLAMGLTFLLGLLAAGVLTHRFTRDNAMAQLLEEAAIMTGQARAVSDYTAREIAPLLAEPSRVQFLPQSVPFWAAHTTFAALQADFPDHSVRVPALNPTNPSNRAADWQADIITLFRNNPALQEHVGQRPSPNGPILTVSRPVRIEDRACLRCHSTPDAAPAAMVALYGEGNGFGWQLGETVGAQVVSVPMRVALERARRSFRLVMGGLAGVFLLMTALLNLLVHGLVVLPARRIAAVAQAVSLGDTDLPELTVAGQDEISRLAESFNRMRRSYLGALRLLERDGSVTGRLRN